MQILIADDNPEIINELRVFLETQNHTVIEAGDGTEALEIFQRENIGGVMSALTMPKMGGIELLKELKSINSHVPFVLISRHGDADNIDFLESVGSHEVRRDLACDKNNGNGIEISIGNGSDEVRRAGT